jgi:uncharacterized repeat protein (TIGR02543 family)
LIASSSFIRSGYSFTGWNTAADGSGTAYAAGETIPNIQEDIVLFAQWARGNNNSDNNSGGYGNNNSGRVSSGSSSPDTNSTLSDTGQSYDKAEGGDLAIDLGIDDNEFISLKNGSAVLKKDENYSVTGNKYILKESYLTALANGEYTLTVDMSEGVDPTFKLTVTDSAIPNEVPYTNPFADVAPEQWYSEAVEFVNKNGLMKGTQTHTFSPAMELTRGMVVTILWNLEGNPSGLNKQFTDIAEDAYYYQASNWAAERGIVSGVGNGLYDPDKAISRQDLAVILNNYAAFAGITLSAEREYTGFSDDADIANYAKEAIERFFKAMIINGGENSGFNPKGEATRAEAAVMLMKFLEDR